MTVLKKIYHRQEVWSEVSSNSGLVCVGILLELGLAADLVVDRQPGRTQWAEDLVEDGADGVGGPVTALLNPALRIVDFSFALVLDEFGHCHFIQGRGLLVFSRSLAGDGRRAHFLRRFGGCEAGAGRHRRVKSGTCEGLPLAGAFHWGERPHAPLGC